MPLPKTTQDSIKADAKRYTKDEGYQNVYIAGATAEAERADSIRLQLEAQDANVEILLSQLHEERERAQGMHDRLCFILERLKAAEDGERLNYEALIYGIVHELQQWKEVEKEPERPCPHCGKELNRDRNLCCRECGKEVENDSTEK